MYGYLYTKSKWFKGSAIYYYRDMVGIRLLLDNILEIRIIHV